MDSVLNSIKKMLGLMPEYNAFDMDILIHINTVFSILYQMGIGPDEPFKVESSDDKWSDFIQDVESIEMVKTYVYLKIRLIFDPPTGGVKEAIENTIKELEYRLFISEENRKEFE